MNTAYRNLTAFAAGVLLLSACKQPTPPEGKPVPSVVDNVTSTLYPAGTARQDIAYFDTLCSRLLARADHDTAVNYSNVPVRAFTIRAVDLFAAMGMQVAPQDARFEHIRVYLGYSQEAKKFKLFIVPVQGAQIDKSDAGSDILLDSNGNALLPSSTYPYPPGYLDNKYILDLNAPCPNLCDSRTPLMPQ